MKAYFVAVALEHDTTIHASAAIVFAESDTVMQNTIASIIAPEYTVLASAIAELDEKVLLAIATFAKEKGLI